jgi:6-phosphogluconolactonase (cycloisomerase 2 family)
MLKNKALSAAAAEPVGPWDLSYAYYDDPFAWDISTAVFIQNFSVAVEEATPQDISFKPDGTRMYIVGTAGDEVNEYSLSTAWDISTASYVQNFVVVTEESAASGIFLKPDGTRMYIVGSAGDEVNEYNLSTAWNISTASYVQNFSVATEETAPVGIFFKPDGTRMYIIGSTGDDVNEYSLSTAWDVSTASYVHNFSVAGQDTIPNGIFLKPDGAAFYIMGDSNNRVVKYAISGFSVFAQEANPTGIFFKPDGTRMYIVGSSGDEVNEYSLSTAWDTSTASYVQNFSVAGQDTSPAGIFFKSDGTRMYIVGNVGADINEYSLSTAWDVSTASYVQNFSVATEESSPQGIFFKPDGTRMYIVGIIGDAVCEYSLSTAWDVSTASYVQNFSVVTQETGSQGISFKPDGTRMYIVGSAGDAVYEYSLSTAWDVSSASYVQSFSVAGQDTSPTDIFFKPDGTQMFIIGSGTDKVYSYTLGVQP